MSIIKISQFPTMSASDVDSANDVLPIVDSSTTESKKITLDNLGVSITSSHAISSSYAITASHALNTIPSPTGSLLVTASSAASTITFTKGDGTTFPVSVDTGVFPFTGSAFISGSLTVSGSGGNGKFSAFDFEIDGTSSLRRSNTGNSLYVGNNANWDGIEYGRQNTDYHRFVGNITGSNISASGDITAANLHISGNIISENNANTKIVFKSNSIDSIVNNYNLIKGDASNGATLGDNTLPTTISGSTLFIDNLTDNNPSNRILSYDTSSGRLYFTEFVYSSSTTSTTVGDPIKKTILEGSTTEFVDSTGTVQVAINNSNGNAKFGTSSVTISGSNGNISASGVIFSSKSNINRYGSTIPYGTDIPLQSSISTSNATYSTSSGLSSLAGEFVTEHAPDTSIAPYNFSGLGSGIVLNSRFPGGDFNAITQLASISVENSSSKADFVVGTTNNSGVIHERLKVAHDGVIYGNRLRLTSGSLSWLNEEDTLTAALSSSNAVYSPTSIITPNPANFVTEHSSGPTTYAGSGSAINLISSAKFANPSLSTKNATVQLASVAALNNTHAADFTIGTRTDAAGNAPVTEKVRITHDGKTKITGSLLVDNSGSLTTGTTIVFNNLPTTEPTTTGSLWISGSSSNHPNSGYLMIFNP